MECPRCGKEIPEGSRFCQLCGKRIAANTPPVQRKSRRRAKGSGTVYKLSGKAKRAKPWIAQDGNGKYLGCFATASEAVIFLDTWNTLTAPKKQNHRVTFASVYKMWKPIHDKDVTEKTSKQNDDAFKKAAVLHDKLFADLRTPEYQAVIDKLEEEGASLSLVQKQKTLFTMLCNFAIQNDIIDRNYAEFCKITATEKNPEKHDRIFTPEEMECIFALIDHPEYKRTARILSVLCYTGMRINELLTLERANVDMKNWVIVGGSKTKAGRNRAVPIHDKIRPIIQAWRDEEAHSIYLIQNAKGTTNPVSYRNFNRDYHKLMEHLGIENSTTHNTRHTFSTRLLEVSDQLDVVKTVVGHASIKTTMDTYDHPDVEKLRKEVAKLK